MLKKFLIDRKNNDLRCGSENSFLVKDIYEEIFKRTINPVYIIILSLISSLVVIKPKKTIIEKYFNFFLFILGFLIILFSELSYKFIAFTFFLELVFVLLPIFFIILFYCFMLIKTKFNMRYL